MAVPPCLPAWDLGAHRKSLNPLKPRGCCCPLSPVCTKQAMSARRSMRHVVRDSWRSWCCPMMFHATSRTSSLSLKQSSSRWARRGFCGLRRCRRCCHQAPREGGPAESPLRRRRCPQGGSPPLPPLPRSGRGRPRCCCPPSPHPSPGRLPPVPAVASPGPPVWRWVPSPVP